MSLTIDELEVKLSADAKNANDGLKQFSASLGEFANNLKTLENNSNGNAYRNFNKLATSLNKLTTVDAGKLTALSNSLNTFSQTVNSLGTVDKSVNNFVNAITRLGGVDTSKISIAVTNIDNLKNSVNGLQGIDKSVTSFINAISRFDKVDTGKVSEAVKHIGNFAMASNNLTNVDKSITNFINAIIRLNNVDTSKLIPSIANIQMFSTVVSGLKDVDRSVTNFINAISRLANVGNSVEATSSALPRLGTALLSVLKSVNKVKGVDQSVIAFTNAIGRLAQYSQGFVTFQNNVQGFTPALENLINSLNTLPSVNKEVLTLIEGLGNLASSGANLSTIFDKNNSSTTRFSKGFINLRKVLTNTLSAIKATGKGIGFLASKLAMGVGRVTGFSRAISVLKDRFSHTNRQTKGFVSTIGLFYAKMFLVIRAFKWLGSAVKKSMDYIEEFNYFNVTMGKIAKEWQKDFSKYGYESAEAYASSFEGRLKTKISKMSGYLINEQGGLEFTGLKNLGLNVTELTNYAAGLASITNSLGLTGEASIETSKALTMLAGDMSSFRNVDLTDSMNKFRSGIIGQSRALYGFGIDITNATLQEYAYAYGVEKAVKNMTQAEKAQLRLLAILKQSRSAWGDLANTINSPSNMLRQLKTNIDNVARTLGGMLLPAVSKILPYVNALTIALQALLENIAKFFNIDLSKIVADSGVGYDDQYEDVADDVSETGDQADSTTKKLKKLNKQLAGFDDLNNLTSNKTADSASGDGVTDITGGTVDLTDEIKKAVSEYEKIWNRAFNRMTSKAQKIAKKIIKAFTDAWRNDDASGIGKALARWFNRGMNKALKGELGFRKFINKISTLLFTATNGFIDNFNWGHLGDVVGATLRDVFEAQERWFDNVKWKKLGKGLADSLNHFLQSGALKKYLAKTGSILRAGIETAFGLVTNFNFTTLGNEIGQGINTMLDKMNIKRGGTTAWQKLGITITDGISGIFDSATATMKTIRWEDIRDGIVDALFSIDTVKIGTSAGKFVTSVAEAIYDLASDKDSWSELGTRFADGINSFFENTDFKTLGLGLSNIANGIFDFLTEAIKKVDWEKVGNKIGDFISGLDIFQKAGKAVKLAGKIVKGLAKAFKGSLETAPLETALATLLIGLKITGFGSVLAQQITNKIGTALLTADTTKLKAGGKVLGSALAVAMAGYVGLNVGDLIGNKLKKKYGSKTQKTEETDGLMSYLFGDAQATVGEWKDAFEDAFLDEDSTLSKWFSAPVKGWGMIFDGLDTALENVLNKFYETKAYKGIRKLAGFFGVDLPDSATSGGGGHSFETSTSSTTSSPLTKSAVSATVDVDYKPNQASLDAIKAQNKKLSNIDSTIKYNTDKKSYDRAKQLADRMNNIINGTIKYKVTKVSSNNWSVSKIFEENNIKKNASGGLFRGGTWKDVARYAQGGLPSSGQLFVAREQGPELVGNLGGSTAVINNGQIVSSVAKGVQDALLPLAESMIIAINNQAQAQGASVYIDGKEVFTAVMNQNNSFKNRTGYSAFA